MYIKQSLCLSKRFPSLLKHTQVPHVLTETRSKQITLNKRTLCGVLLHERIFDNELYKNLRIYLFKYFFHGRNSWVCSQNELVSTWNFVVMKAEVIGTK
jgi:hypothetical protein